MSDRAADRGRLWRAAGRARPERPGRRRDGAAQGEVMLGRNLIPEEPGLLVVGAPVEVLEEAA